MGRWCVSGKLGNRPLRRAVRLVFVMIMTIAATHAMAQGAGVGNQARRPAFEALRPSVQQLVDGWLTRDCGVGAEVLRVSLEETGSESEAAFWEAYRMGMPPEYVESETQLLKKRYEDRRIWLNDFGAASLGADRTRKALQVSETEYLRQQLQRSETAYRERALVGLGMVATRASEADLKTIADDRDSPFRSAARDALTRLQHRAPSP